MRLLRRYSGWRTSWDQIVNIDNHGLFLFYDRNAGHGEFYSIDNSGNLWLLKAYQDWRKSWNQILPTGYAKHLLFYDRVSGTGEFYQIDNQGNTTLIKDHQGWRTSWDQIVSGDFTGRGGPHLLFYDRVAGQGEFYKIDSQGNMTFVKGHQGWRTTWDSIVPCYSYKLRKTMLVFYDRTSGHGEIYSVNDDWSLNLILNHQGWRKSWDRILSGYLDFGTSDNSRLYNLLFHDRTAKQDEFYYVDQDYWRFGEAYSAWSTDWTDVVADFRLGYSSMLLFYDRKTGIAELIITYEPKATIREFIVSPNIIQVCQPTAISLQWDVRNANRITISRDDKTIVDLANSQGALVWKQSVSDPEPQSSNVAYTLTAFSEVGQDTNSKSIVLDSQWAVVRSITLTNNTVNSAVSVWFYDTFDTPIREVIARLDAGRTEKIDLPNCEVLRVKAIDIVQNFIRWESGSILGNEKGQDNYSWFN